MPYRKSYNRRPRRRYPPRQQTGYFGQAGVDATKALRMAGKALALLNTEEKYVDNNTAISNQTTTATIQTLFAPTQGDTQTTRNGNSMKVTKVHGKIDVYRNTSSTFVSTSCRVMVLIDHQPNGALPSITDILTTSSVRSWRNVNFGSRYTILFDKKCELDSVQKNYCSYEFHKDLQTHMEFGSNTGGVADINRNNFVFVALSDEATNGPQINRAMRIRFIDN